MSRTLAMKLRTLRLKAKLTQLDVAKACRFSTAQFISNWERGISRPPLDMIPTLSVIYRVPCQKLIDLLYDDRIANAESERQELYRRYI